MIGNRFLVRGDQDTVDVANVTGAILIFVFAQNQIMRAWKKSRIQKVPDIGPVLDSRFRLKIKNLLCFGAATVIDGEAKGAVSRAVIIVPYPDPVFPGNRDNYL